MKSPTVYIPCCDASLDVVKVNSYLFNKFWPDAKVVYLGFSKPEYDFYNKNHTFVSMAPEQIGGSSSWTRYIHDYLATVEDELVLFSIDDYLVCKPPDGEMLDAVVSLMNKNQKIGRFDLTFDSQVEGSYTAVGKYRGFDVIQKYPKSQYRISTQPSIWRREFLLKFLNNDWSPWQFELEGSVMAAKMFLPEQTLAFYDKTMERYALRTVAKGAVSRFNPSKFNVLGLDMPTIKELVDEGFFTENDLIWGQHSNNPPSFYDKQGYDFHPIFLDFHPTSKTGFEEYHCVYDDPEQPLLTVNLWDKNFIHTLRLPGFGYITSQGERTPRGKKLRYLPMKKNFNEYSGVTIFTDKFLNSKFIKDVDSPIKIGWIQEPPVVHGWVYDEIPNYIDDLDYLFTFSKELAEKYEKCIEFSWCFLRVDQKDWGIHDKSKMFSMIASDKKWAPGHLLRHDVSEKLAQKHDIDLWGRGYKSFPELGKIDAIRDYMFTIVIQNCQFDTFFTDFVDPLVAGTIPIFWGTREVSSKFNPNGVIFFDSLEELDEILSNLTEEDYYSRLDAVKENFEIAKTYWRSDDQLADKIYETLELKK